MRARLPLVLLLSGCVGASSTTGLDGAADGGGTPPDGPVGSPADMAVPAGAVQAQIGPLALPAGSEAVQCVTVRLGNPTALDVTGIDASLATGSHHLIAYLSKETQEDRTPRDCASFEGVSHGETPILIAQSPTTKLRLLGGVAYRLEANQMVRLEAHYINASAQPLTGMGTVTFLPAVASASYQRADVMFCGSVAALVAPGLPANQKTALPVGFYAGGGDVDLTTLKIYAFTSHQHHFGSEFKIWKGTVQTKTSTLLYQNTNWAEAPLATFDGPGLLSFGAGEGLAWQCSYDTTGATKTTTFGESALDEMCFFWAYYYPSVGRFVSGDCTT